jgi:hypothetical protein
MAKPARSAVGLLKHSVQWKIESDSRKADPRNYVIKLCATSSVIFWPANEGNPKTVQNISE